jgi:hypothetical protein
LILVWISSFYSQVVVSAGIFRVFGKEVAELPLIATKAEYQKQVILFTLEMNFTFLLSVSFYLNSYLKSNRIMWNIYLLKMLLFSCRVSSDAYFPA